MTTKRAALCWGTGAVVLAAIGGLAFYIHQSHAPDLVAQAFLDGMQAEKRGELSGAASRYKQATVLDPVFCSGYFNLGDAYERQAKTSEALVSFQEALACFQGGRVHSFLGPPSEVILNGDIQRTNKRIEKLKLGVPQPTS